MEECIICFEETDHFITFECCNHKTCAVCYPLIINNTGKCPICQREIIQITNEHYSIKYKLIFGKIINILETNKIIAENIFN